MINLDLNKICGPKYNNYYFVVGIAKRARKIYDSGNIRVKQDDIKPVTLAVTEFLEHKYILHLEDEL